MGVAGFVKQLLEECALSDIFHHLFGIPRTRKSWIRGMYISSGLVYLKDYEDYTEARRNLARYFYHYNHERLNQVLDSQTPTELAGVAA